MTTNPYLRLGPRALTGVWGMRAAELMAAVDDPDGQATRSRRRDTALMLFAAAMHLAQQDIDGARDTNDRLLERRTRFEVLKRAASLSVPVHPELWLLEAQSEGALDVRHAVDSDEGMCEALGKLPGISSSPMRTAH